MKTAIEPKETAAIVLTSIVAMLGGLLYWEWTQGVQLEQELIKLRKIPVASVQVKTVLPEFALPAADTGFPEMIARSLFSVSRRGSASANQSGHGAMKKGQFILAGVLVTPTQKSALLRDVKTNKTETVALKGVVRGLTLGEVGPSRVVLHQGTESEELVLNVQTGQRASVNQSAPAPAKAPSTLLVSATPPEALSPPASLPANPLQAASAPNVAQSSSRAVAKK